MPRTLCQTQFLRYSIGTPFLPSRKILNQRTITVLIFVFLFFLLYNILHEFHCGTPYKGEKSKSNGFFSLYFQLQRLLSHVLGFKHNDCKSKCNEQLCAELCCLKEMCHIKLNVSHVDLLYQLRWYGTPRPFCEILRSYREKPPNKIQYNLIKVFPNFKLLIAQITLGLYCG